MFKSFQNLYEDCQTLSVDTSTASLAFFKTQINTAITKAYSELNAQIFFVDATNCTAASTTAYPLPYDCEKIHTIKVNVSDRDYVVQEYPNSENSWNALLSAGSQSDYPTYYFVKKDTYEFYPESSTANYLITTKYTRRQKLLSVDDYTGGTITSIANEGVALVGASTTWVAAMTSRFFKIDTDFHWYEIASVDTATTITLKREWGSTSVSAGTSAYTIGEMSLIPEPYQEIPINYALWQYYNLKKDAQMSKTYEALWIQGLNDMIAYGNNSTTSGVIEEDVNVIDSNDWPTITT